MLATISPTLTLASVMGHLTGSQAATEISQSLMKLAAQHSYTTENQALFQSIEAGLDGVSDQVDPIISKRQRKDAPLQSSDADEVSEFLGYLAHDKVVLKTLRRDKGFRALLAQQNLAVPALEETSRQFLSQHLYRGTPSEHTKHDGSKPLSPQERGHEREKLIQAASKSPIGPLQTEAFLAGQGWRVPFRADPAQGEAALEDVAALMLYNSLPPQDIQRLGFFKSLSHYSQFFGMAKIVDEAARRYADPAVHARLAHSLSLQFFRQIGSETLLLNGHRLNELKAAQDDGRGIIILANHSSHFDIPKTFIDFRDLNPVYVARASLGHWPVIGSTLRHGGSLLLDREDPKYAVKAIQEFTVKSLQQKRAVFVFPEGTRRPKSDFGMGTFEIGAFAGAKAALYSKEYHLDPLLVTTAMQGTDHVLPKWGLRLGSGHAVVTSVLPPIDVAKVAEKVSRPRLADELRRKSWSLLWHELAALQAYMNEEFPRLTRPS